jgi:hypothetical protein
MIGKDLDMLRFNTALVGRTIIRAAFALTLGVSAAQSQSYPRIVGDADSRSVEYGPEAHNNVVGGGRVTASIIGEDSTLRHHDPEYAQQGRRGVVARVIGGGDERQVVWVPQGTSASALAQPGGDGSLPPRLGRRGNMPVMQADASARG